METDKEITDKMYVPNEKRINWGLIAGLVISSAFWYGLAQFLYYSH